MENKQNKIFFQLEFDKLIKNYEKNEKEIKILKRSDMLNTTEYKDIIKNQNDILLKLNNLQTQVSNSNYEKQIEIKALNDEVYDLQNEVQSLEEKKNELQKNSDYAEQINIAKEKK